MKPRYPSDRVLFWKIFGIYIQCLVAHIDIHTHSLSFELLELAGEHAAQVLGSRSETNGRVVMMAGGCRRRVLRQHG